MHFRVEKVIRSSFDYLLKIGLTSENNNQIILNYIDVIRRLSSLIISVLLYQNIIYVFIFIIISIGISFIPFNMNENNTIEDSIV